MKYLLGLLFVHSASAAFASSEYEVNAGLLVGHDTNVSIDEIDLYASQGDRFVTGSFRLGYANDISQNQSVKASYSLSDKHYFENQQFDLQNHIISLAYNIKHEELTFGLSYRYVDSNLDAAQFLTLHQVSPSISWFVSKQHYLRFAYNFHDKTLERNGDRNANSHEFSANYYYFMNGLNGYLTLALKAKSEVAKNELFNYSAQQFRLAYQKRFDILDAPVKASIAWSARIRDYNAKINPVIQDFRKDKRYAYSFSLEWEINRHWLIDGQIEYSDRQSNLDSVDFTQWVSLMGVNYHF